MLVTKRVLAVVVVVATAGVRAAAPQQREHFFGRRAGLRGRHRAEHGRKLGRLVTEPLGHVLHDLLLRLRFGALAQSAVAGQGGRGFIEAGRGRRRRVHRTGPCVRGLTVFPSGPVQQGRSRTPLVVFQAHWSRTLA